MKILVCRNPWCKAQFRFDDKDLKEVDGKKVYPKQCNKCKSFNDDLSGGVTWEDKKYEGDPWKGEQEIKYNIKNYR